MTILKSMSMYENEELPPCLSWYENQIAGHHPSVIKNGVRQIGILKEQGHEDRILKLVQSGVRGEKEVNFYNSVFQNPHPKSPLGDVAQFMPQFYGKRNVQIANRDYEFIELEDITHYFAKPCIMDIKMGKVSYDPSASDAKKASEAAKCVHQQEFGFRILGYRLPPDASGEIRVKDRNWGRLLTPDTLEGGFEEYLSHAQALGHRKTILADFLTDLDPILTWFKSQREVQLYASSLLFVYEGDATRSPKSVVKMIDFSHVFYEDCIDENYLHGVHTIINMFSAMLNKS